MEDCASQRHRVDNRKGSESEDQCMLQDGNDSCEWGRAGHCPLHHGLLIAQHHRRYGHYLIPVSSPSEQGRAGCCPLHQQSIS